jgi:serine/threonine protein kinase
MQPETAQAAFEKRKRALFEAAVQLAETDQATLLATTARIDPNLAQAVRRLLAASRHGSDGVLNRPVYERKPLTPPPAPRAIGKYVVLKHLGTGGMGSVYLSKAPDAAEQVAIKIIRSDLESDSARFHFARERDILKRLRHPNVCRILDADVAAGGTPFIVMEYIEGEQLDAFCSRMACPVERRLLLFSQVLAGVEYFHSCNVVHRDLKPSNLFVGLAGSVKILDFGLAKMIDHQKGRTGHGLTTTRFPFMTIAYASPEQLSGSLSGRASDIYALGLICYELLTGSRPFSRGSEQSPELRFQALSSEVPVPPSRRVGALPKAIDSMVMNALQFDPDYRYGSAATFLRDLVKCLEGSAVQPRNSRRAFKAAAP